MKTKKTITSLLLNLTLIIIAAQIIVHFYFTPNFKNCISSKAQEDYIAGSCPYFLSEEELEQVLMAGIKKYNSNVIRESYLATMPDSKNPQSKINIKKRKILMDCVSNNGCHNTYLYAKKYSLYGLKTDD